jgi:hypothetical protein
MNIENQPEVWEVGKRYFLRTVSGGQWYTGVLVAVNDKELVLDKASWIIDNDRFIEAMKTGIFNDFEVYPQEARIVLTQSSVICVIDANQIN